MRRLLPRLTTPLSERAFAWLLAAARRPRAFIVGLVLIPLTVVLAVTYSVNASMWQAQSQRHLLMTARLAAQILDETLTDTWRFEQLISTQPEFLEATRSREASRLGRVLQHAVTLIPKVDLALFISPQGRVLASSGDDTWVGRDVSSEDSFQGASLQGQPYISAVHLREDTSLEKVVAVVWPVTHRGELLGLLQVQYRLETIRAWLAKIRVEPSGFLYLVDHRHQLVVYPFQVLPGRPKVVSSWPPVAHRLPADGDTLAFRGGRKAEPWLAGIAPVGTIGWRVVAVQPTAAALQPLHRLFWALVMLLGMLAAATLAVGWHWARVQAMSLHLLGQNAKLLKQLQQRRLLDRGRPGKTPEGTVS